MKQLSLVHLAASVVGLVLLLPLFTQVTHAQQDTGSQARVQVELNKLQDVEDACRVTFLMENGLADEIEVLGFEVAIINEEGLVSGLILMRSGRLPSGRQRVKQFDLPDVDCASIDRLLLNEVVECEGVALDRCREAIAASSRGDVSFE